MIDDPPEIELPREKGIIGTEARIEIYDLRGALVRSEVQEYSPSASQPLRVSVKNLRPGLYFIVLHADGLDHPLTYPFVR